MQNSNLSAVKSGAKPMDKCLNYQQIGHWKRDCPKLKASDASGKQLVFEANCSVYSTSWILDSGASTHICVLNQVLDRSRKLRAGEVSINVGSGHSVAATHVGSKTLLLSSMYCLLLSDVLVLPKGLKNIVSIPALSKLGYEFRFTDNVCHIYFRNENVGNATLINGLHYVNLKKQCTYC